MKLLYGDFAGGGAHGPGDDYSGECSNIPPFHHLTFLIIYLTLFIKVLFTWGLNSEWVFLCLITSMFVYPIVIKGIEKMFYE